MHPWNGQKIKNIDIYESGIMQHELLLEIGTEEIPAGFIMPAVQNLQKNLTAKLAELHLQHGAVHTAATPRRLAICIDGLIDRQPDNQEEVLGPPKKAAFDSDNKPTKAAIGFAKSRGASVDDLEIAKTDKGEYIMLRIDQKGQPTVDLLKSLLPETILGLAFPKSMRWGAGDMAFARPIHWLLALYDGNVVPFEIGSIHSDTKTKGHRFMQGKPNFVTDYQEYIKKLRKAEVIADIEERKEAVLSEISKAAKEAGGTILQDDELVDIVTNLVEKPFAVCGTFEKRFLELPRDVLITSMREHQKYFTVVNNKGDLLPNFVAVNNTAVKDNKLAAEGHQRVLRARLEDALFFFMDDRKKRLEERVNDLSGVIFQNKLGTMLEKTERTMKLAAMLAEELSPDDVKEIQRGAYLAKADLLTEMVNEFPTLQGVIGKDYAFLNGEPESVAVAIKEHYMPVRAGGALPGSIHGQIVGMADRLDTIAGCFGIGKTPTGAADPFGLRRLALGLLHIIDKGSFTISLKKYLTKAMELYGDKLSEKPDNAASKALEFIKGRFVNDLAGAGIPVETIEAVTSITFDNPTDCKHKINALVSISDQETFTLLAGSFKRVMNIIKDHNNTNIDISQLKDPAEKKLAEVLQEITKETIPLLEKCAYTEAMRSILKMKEPIDTFFDEVMVMADDENLKKNRLALLTSIAQLFLQIGDFSKMYSLGQ